MIKLRLKQLSFNNLLADLNTLHHKEIWTKILHKYSKKFQNMHSYVTEEWSRELENTDKNSLPCLLAQTEYSYHHKSHHSHSNVFLSVEYEQDDGYYYQPTSG